MWSHGSSSSAVVSGTEPFDDTDAQRGSRYSGTTRAIAADVAGASSDGFMTTQLPAAIAAAAPGKGQLQRVVPRPDYRGQRRAAPAAASSCRAARPSAWRHAAALRTHFFRFLRKVLCVTFDIRDLGRPGLERMLAEVFRQRIQKLLLALDHHALESPRAAARRATRGLNVCSDSNVGLELGKHLRVIRRWGNRGGSFGHDLFSVRVDNPADYPANRISVWTCSQYLSGAARQRLVFESGNRAEQQVGIGLGILDD